MLAKKIKYEDYNGEEREETFYFKLDETEVFKMEIGSNGGMEATVNKIVSERDGKKIMEMFEEIVLTSYGEKSLDGKYFEKSPEISQRFKCTNAYNVLMMEICTDAEAAGKFINAVLPKQKDPNQSIPAPALTTVH